MKKKTMAIIIILVLVIIAATYMGTKPTKVKYTVPIIQTYVQSVLSSGEISADESVIVISESGGTLANIDFSQGTILEASQEIAKIESQTLLNSIKEKMAALSSAQINYDAVVTTDYKIAAEEVKKLTQEIEIQKRQYKDNLSLFESGAIPQTNLQSIKDIISKLETDLKVADIKMKSYSPSGSEAKKQSSVVEQARANLNSSQSDISKYSIKSPFAGVVVQKFVSQGEIIQSGARIAEIAKSGKRYAEIKVDEKNAVYVKKGQVAYVYPSSNPEKKIKSEVSWISPVVDKASGTILVKIEIPKGSQAEFLLSMTVTAELVIKEFPEALIIDANYIVSDGETDYVFVKNEDRAHRLPVIVQGQDSYVMISQKPDKQSKQSVNDIVISEKSIILYPEKLSDLDKVQIVESGGK